MRKAISDHCWPVIHGAKDWDAVMLDPASTEAGSSRRIEVLMNPQTHRQFVLEQAKRFKAAGWTVLYCVNSIHRAVDVVQGLIDDAKAAGIEPVVFQKDPLLWDKTIARYKDYRDDFEFPGSADGYDDAGFVMATATNLQSKVERAIEQLSLYSEQPVKVLVIDEFIRHASSLDFKGHVREHHVARVAVSSPVRSIEPQPCPFCGAMLGVQLGNTGLMYRCGRKKMHRAVGPSKSYGVTATVTVYSPVGRKPKTSRRAWTEEESARAIELRRQGLTYKAIGEQLGRSMYAVRFLLSQGGYEGIKQRQATRAYLRQRIAEMDAGTSS